MYCSNCKHDAPAHAIALPAGEWSEGYCHSCPKCVAEMKKADQGTDDLS